MVVGHLEVFTHPENVALIDLGEANSIARPATPSRWPPTG